MFFQFRVDFFIVPTMQQFTRSQPLTNLTNAVKPRPPVPEIVKNWRPKTHAGRLPRAGYFTNYLDVRSHHIVKEPEIADYFVGYALSTLPLKTIPIGSGQYRFKAFVAIGDGKSFIGLGQRCAKDRSSAENGAARNAKLNLFKIRTTWIKPVTGQYNDVTVRLFPHEQLNVRPMIRKILLLCGIRGCKVEVSTERDSHQLVLALFDALMKLEQD